MVSFARSGGGVGGTRGSFLFSLRILREVKMGGVEFAKELVKANATVDKEDKYGWTALIYAVKKMGNLMSEKRPHNMCKGVVFSVVTLPTRYRRILLLPPSSPFLSPNVLAMHLSTPCSLLSCRSLGSGTLFERVDLCLN